MAEVTMQKLTVFVIGTLKESWAKAASELYLGRMRDVKLEVMELAASKEKDPRRQAADESARLLIAAERNKGLLWALDETGVRVTSRQFADLLSKARDRGEGVTLLLGGAYGLTNDVRSRADLTVRLSDMTLPHELCRIVLLEQLYRAQEINKGSGYHHV